ncbi:formin-like protein 1 [Drosophila rhopaloa]|uniref:Uncharacterized protein n=1 Tax=Drosophila rhopaloa TaxID=1041015 RepID=A0ABM5J7D2_DRORH|nr:formin-like protein 1 [Drosophila rhopaloa]
MEAGLRFRTPAAGERHSLVSRSPSPNPESEDEERITDVELEEEEEAGVRSAGQEDEVPTIDLASSEEEEEDIATEMVSPEVSSDEEDEPRRAAKARMAFRRIRRAAAGFGRIRLGDAAPSGRPEEVKRIFATRAEVVRRVFAQRAVARAAAAAREWQKRLDEGEAEEAAIWAQPGPPEQPPPQAPPPPSPPQPSPPLSLSLSQPPPPPSPPRGAPPPSPSPPLTPSPPRAATPPPPPPKAVGEPTTFGGQQPLGGDGRGRVAAQGGSRGQQAADESP